MMSDYFEKTGRIEFGYDENSVIGPGNIHYESEPEVFYFGQLGLCGCGRPEEVHRFLIDCLSARREGNNLLDKNKIAELVKENSDTVAEFILHFLDSKYLTEHGSSVYGSFPTERGKQFIEVGPMEE